MSSLSCVCYAPAPRCPQRGGSFCLWAAAEQKPSFSGRQSGGGPGRVEEGLLQAQQAEQAAMPQVSAWPQTVHVL